MSKNRLVFSIGGNLCGGGIIIADLLKLTHDDPFVWASVLLAAMATVMLCLRDYIEHLRARIKSNGGTP